MSVEPNNNTKFRLIIFDLDGVLTTPISSWVWVHNHFGVNNDVSYNRYMRNEIDDHEFMRSDIALWLAKHNPLHIKKIIEVLDTVPITPGFDKLIKILKFLGLEIGIVSSGLEPLAIRVAREGGINQANVYANGLETDYNGNLTGEGILRVKLRAKGVTVKHLEQQLGFGQAETVSIGNGETDIPMFQASGFSIAFDPISKNLAQNANVVIHKKNLIEIIPHICDLTKLPTEIIAECSEIY